MMKITHTEALIVNDFIPRFKLFLYYLTLFIVIKACPDGQYACYSASNNPKCIPQAYVCNGLNDCGDLSDEQGCGCASDKFTCKNQQCIPIQYKCNGYPDCDDQSDEDTHMCRG